MKNAVDMLSVNGQIMRYNLASILLKVGSSFDVSHVQSQF